jgi:translation initiation factor 1
MNVCPKCGLLRDLCVCETIAREKQRISVRVVKRKFGKLITLVEGIDKKDINLKELAKKLKGKLACGGTLKGDTIELQGNHITKVKEELIKLGFPEETIVKG